jgi:hypothetical protein
MAMNLLDWSFLKQFKTFAVRVLSDLKVLGFASDKTLLLMLKNKLIIHEEKRKEVTAVSVVLYVIN